MTHNLKKSDVMKIYNAELVRIKGQGEFAPTGAALLAEALQATRTEVHASLQLELPHPKGDGVDADDVHHIQKKHGKSLWVETDRLIANAGITVRGVAS